MQRLRNTTGRHTPNSLRKLRKNQIIKSPIRAPLPKTNTKYYADCTALPLMSISNSLDKRSQSLEGFLDTSSDIQNFIDSTENLNCAANNSTETSTSTNRRSKSLDDLFNDDCVIDETEPPSISSEKNCEQDLIIVDNSLLSDHKKDDQNNTKNPNQDSTIFQEIHPKNSFLDRYFKKVKKLIK